jgi:hypothetical protein
MRYNNNNNNNTNKKHARTFFCEPAQMYVGFSFLGVFFLPPLVCASCQLPAASGQRRAPCGMFMLLRLLAIQSGSIC